MQAMIILSIPLTETDKNLDEVVVVGYSTKKKGELTSAVTVVDEKKLKDVTTNDVGSMLQGKVAGLAGCEQFRCARRKC